MYTRTIRRNQRWGFVLQQDKYLVRRPVIRDHTVSQSSRSTTYILTNHLTRNHHSPVASRDYLSYSWNSQLRRFSSEGNGSNASEDSRFPLNKEKTEKGKNVSGVEHFDSHAQLGEQDQIEWLNNEKLASESRKESPFLNKRERLKNEFLRRIQPWETIQLSWESFPYYVHEHTKDTLVECVSSHIKQKSMTSKYGARLDSSSGRILLQSVPGTELYRERLVRALARDTQVPLLVLDSSVLAPYDCADDYNEESESDDDIAESDQCTSESEGEEETDANNDETSSGEAKIEGTDDEERYLEISKEVLKKLGADIEDIEKRMSEQLYGSSEVSEAAPVDHCDKAKRPLKKGDQVRYVGSPKNDEAKHRPLSSGQRGEVYEVSGNRVAVIFDYGNDKTTEGSEKKPAEQPQMLPIHWVDVKDVKYDLDMQAVDGYIAMEALNEVLQSIQPLIVYFPDSSQWLSRAVPKTRRKEFVDKVQEMFNKLSGPIVMICGQNKIETGSKEREKFTMVLPNFSRLVKLPLPLKGLTEGFTGGKKSEENEIYKLFTNVMRLHPPKEEDTLRLFKKQLGEDRRIVISRSNINELLKALEEHELLCTDLYQVNTDGVILTKQKAEKAIGWAKNHYLASCPDPLVKGGRLSLPRESLEISIARLRKLEDNSLKPSQNLKNIAKDEYERNFVSAVVAPGEIGVKFEDIGALEDVKKALNELVILPMRRPELFSRGNLLRPCKGILLFGPPGTGKTLLAKALATEAGANFISITGSTLTSKWFGDAEKLTKALFSFATKLAPVIIFVDEIDSLLGARGGSSEHEATRRMRNEFMAAWDGLRSKDSQRILILGATNRPFDLDDAVIRRLPRRIYVDLPDAKNRLKILKIFLTPENLESGFQFDKLAKETEGYSGSDLKNLCIAAAYRPVQELLQEEQKGARAEASPGLRSLSLDDFIQSKAKVSPSVAYDATTMNELRKWNEQYGEGGSRTKSPFGF
ncbi:AAA+ ATPase domain [Arabidopsis thaliana x Arabidopsis arenosa]|uniref:AAA+ ATPase domain n=1 Tax=Arabidopsis thaliana x Arabidopsis arenosa TaxID=1240361 RepID=A0A8T2CCF4_9BRAS|nr:AAA+ ATPase domain [Arabidopsis thaliana x Arabidopsis arenosa]